MNEQPNMNQEANNAKNVVVNNNTAYTFGTEQPKTLEEVNNLIFGLTYNQVTPIALTLYLICRINCCEKSITKDQIYYYADYFFPQDIKKSICELVDLGYLVEIKDEVVNIPSEYTPFTQNFLIRATSKCKNTYDSNILCSEGSPIAVAVYIACIENSVQGFVTEEDIQLVTHWSDIYISRGFEELQKLGYLQRTDWYRTIDGRNLDYYAFRKSLNKNFIDADKYFGKVDTKKQ